MDQSQWQILQQMLQQRDAARQAAQMRDPSLRRNAAPGNGSMANAGGAVPGMAGSQSGADPNPFSQVPGGGSTANALPYGNPMADDRRYYTDMADNGFANSMAGYGTALGTMAFLPPNPATLALALGGAGLGAVGGLMQGHGERNAKRLGYQGN